MTVRLTYSDLIIAGQIGLSRHAYALNKGLKDQFGADPKNGWGLHIEGACAEAAVAKLLNIRHDGTIGQTGPVDLIYQGRTLEVRCTRYRNGRLIIHPQDSDESFFVLVTGAAPVYKVVGWIQGRDGKIAAYWDEPEPGRPAFFVPQSALVEVPVNLQAA